MITNLIQVIRYARSFKELLEGLAQGDTEKAYCGLEKFVGDNVDKTMLYKVIQHAISIANASSEDEAREKVKQMLRDFGADESVVDDIIETGKMLSRIVRGELDKIIDILPHSEATQSKPVAKPVDKPVAKPVTKPVTPLRTILKRVEEEE